MLSVLTSVAMDITLGIAWWVTKKTVYIIIAQLPALPSLF
jgi:hypothetical protein